MSETVKTLKNAERQLFEIIGEMKRESEEKGEPVFHQDRCSGHPWDIRCSPNQCKKISGRDAGFFEIHIAIQTKFTQSLIFTERQPPSGIQLRVCPGAG